jgi:hypothetical protein
MRGVRVDLGWFLTFPKRESKANDQKLKEWPQPCDTTDFCNRIRGSSGHSLMTA